MLKLHNIAHWPTERISQRVLYLLIALAVMVFALFYFVAYDRPFADDPRSTRSRPGPDLGRVACRRGL